MFKVIDNLLDKDTFNKVYNMFYHDKNFPWFRSSVLDYKDYMQFVHFFYYDYKPNSIYNEPVRVGSKARVNCLKRILLKQFPDMRVF